jgi:UDP-N-acetylglucosamine 2-epimerase (non-hydrolysing)
MREGTPASRVTITGNTVIDAFIHVAGLHLDLASTPLGQLSRAGLLDDRPIVLVTCHRRENFGAGLVAICAAILQLAEERPEVSFVLPVHPNPQVSQVVHGLLSEAPNVALLPPLEYHPLVWLLQRCSFLITDSGGLQEEATAVGRPVLVLRESTERPEGVTAGTARLVGSDKERILKHARLLLDDPAVYQRMSQRTYPYGDGRSAARIADFLCGSAVPADFTFLDNHAYEGAELPLLDRHHRSRLTSPQARSVNLPAPT